jgi:Group II intron, maturase-specific domain
MPLKTQELIEELNPLLRGWGEYYKRAHVRKLFQRLDGWIRATHLVTSVPALAQCWLETVACDQALRRVRACSIVRFNSFSCISASLNLCESCLCEMCTGSLGGGRRPARERASSDPTSQTAFEEMNSRDHRRDLALPHRDFWTASQNQQPISEGLHFTAHRLCECIA